MSAETDDSNALSPTLLRVIGVGDVVMFAIIGLLLFDDVIFGAIAGTLTGVGTVWFLSWSLGGSDDANRRGEPAGLTAQIHRGAAGAALMGSGIIAIALMFVREDPLFALGLGLGVAIVEYPILSRVLPKDVDEEDVTVG